MYPVAEHERRSVNQRLDALEDGVVTKEVVKEALKEWLDEKFVQFGKWTAASLAALLLAAFIYFILVTNGWKQHP